ncbi:two component transcriptional regulator, LuxR family protein [Pseudooceanicola batsensis HTCC2597]|uniref:Two component transcriptional regulator, LuxR family protein n=1 Tax=Pseudooceanicola batsensis (strain ATCC BAA-863 / DSM 15984 / KCTC 12145 / HTCC2597) TaxID=252305 RepID=A3U0N4_PSEBH|nr:response regulator [Pseudooceanicola batsensis]EAQ02325.1 two component transcriptional regulator, LuxR family protein [Pseudooceanicola batsensis HTCC2597]
MPDSKPLVFVVDDDQDVRTSLSRALDQRGMQVETFPAAEAFLAAYDGERPACVVLDYGMPGMNGLELLEVLNQRQLPLGVVFITGHGGVPESVQAMKGGAVDFLEKPFRQPVLIERIQAALDLADSRYGSFVTHRDLKARFDRLTAREEEIVSHVVANPAEVSSKEIGNALGISPRTVDHHRARILEKLQVKSLVELIDLVTRLRFADGSRRL